MSSNTYAKDKEKANPGLLVILLNLTDKILEWLAMSFIVLMTLIISLQVFTRYVFSMTPRWSEEVALLLMVWFGFIGIAIGVKKGIHISIEYFVSLCSEPVQRIIEKIDNVLIMIFGIFLTKYGYLLAKATAGSTLPATQWPGYVLYAIVPVSGVMIVFYSIPRVFERRGNKKW